MTERDETPAPVYTPPWVGREDELDPEELAALYESQGRKWGK